MGRYVLDRQMGRLDVISIKIDKNDGEWSREWHWGQQVGGMFGQSMVEDDGSPRWVVITRSGMCVRENRKIDEKSIKFDGNWWVGNGTGAI